MTDEQHRAERRADYLHLEDHIKATARRLAIVASFAGTVGVAATWLGFRVISPGANVAAVAREVRNVRDTMTAEIAAVRVRQANVEKDHYKLTRRVDFLVVVKCNEIDGTTRRFLAAAGFSCTDMIREVQQSNGNHE